MITDFMIIVGIITFLVCVGVLFAAFHITRWAEHMKAERMNKYLNDKYRDYDDEDLV